MSAAIQRWSPWAAKLVWLGLGALSIALRHPWLGGFLLASVASSVWLRLLRGVVYGDERPRKDTKGQRLRATIFTVVFFAGLFAVARVLSPLWR